jgi:hypothetical protein
MDWEVIMKRFEGGRYTLYLGRQDVKTKFKNEKLGRGLLSCKWLSMNGNVAYKKTLCQYLRDKRYGKMTV